jgi:hypothetical protein
MRLYSLAVALVAALATVGCSDATPFEPASSTSFDVVPGTGNPAVDAELQNFNNEVVGCAVTDNLDFDSASHIALLTSVLRFSPSGSDNKTEALLGAIANQIENAQRKGEISPACYAQLTSRLDTIQGLL